MKLARMLRSRPLVGTTYNINVDYERDLHQGVIFRKIVTVTDDFKLEVSIEQRQTTVYGSLFDSEPTARCVYNVYFVEMLPPSFTRSTFMGKFTHEISSIRDETTNCQTCFVKLIKVGQIDRIKYVVDLNIKINEPTNVKIISEILVTKCHV